MERINEQLYQANIDLVDKNKALEVSLKILEKRIDNAIEYIDQLLEHIIVEYNGEYKRFENTKKILKGEDYGDNW